MALTAGTRIGIYEVTGFLGAGGMGEVYRARDTKLDRDVALKVLPAAFIADRDRLVRFDREAKILASLNHPNIAAIHGLEETADTKALVLELVEGPTLADRIAVGPIPVDEALAISRQIADALKSAHAQGIVHRDLKPANIKLRPDGTVKVLDFGLAKDVARTEADDVAQASTMTASATVEGSIVGTPAYMSPEQVRGKPVDTRADIWSFGCVLYEALTGRRAFLEETVIETLAAILERGPDWGALPAATPPTVTALLRRCLDQDPRRRPPDVSDSGSGITEAVDPPAARAPSRSIAVLPFANISADPEQEYFCEGLAEELIDALAKLDGVQVVARTSSFQFKGQSQDLRRVGEQLGVATVLEGSVRKAGDRVRISTQLINAADGYHLWSERFDRDLSDIFAVQDEIARAVVDSLRVQLLGGPEQGLVRRPTASLDAYTSYMRGRHHQFSRYNLRKATQCYEQAAQDDPSYAAAWAGIADAVTTECYLALLPPREASVKARSAVERALLLDDNLSEAHAARGRVRYFLDWDWRGAEEAFRRALALNPANTTAKIEYAHFLAVMGRTEEALTQVEQVVVMDPLSARARSRAGLILLLGRRYDEAVDACRQALELQPDMTAGLWYLNLTFLALQRYEDALSTLQRVPDAAARTGTHVGFLGATLASAGQQREARSILTELKARGPHAYVSPYSIARVHVALGEMEDAIDGIEQAYREGSPDLLLLQQPYWDAVREHPRGQDLLRRMNLPDLRQ